MYWRRYALPLLWNVAVNVAELFHTHVAIAFVVKFPQTLYDLMTDKQGVLSAWANRNGLEVNPSKTELVCLFTEKYIIWKLPKLLGETLTLSGSAKNIEENWTGSLTAEKIEHYIHRKAVGRVSKNSQVCITSCRLGVPVDHTTANFQVFIPSREN